MFLAIIVFGHITKVFKFQILHDCFHALRYMTYIHLRTSLLITTYHVGNILTRARARRNDDTSMYTTYTWLLAAAYVLLLLANGAVAHYVNGYEGVDIVLYSVTMFTTAGLLPGVDTSLNWYYAQPLRLPLRSFITTTTTTHNNNNNTELPPPSPTPLSSSPPPPPTGMLRARYYWWVSL